MSAHNGFAAQERQMTRGAEVAWREGMDLRNWYPVTASCEDGQLVLAWRDMTDIAFTDSFFHNTLGRQAREQRRVCHTPLSALQQFDDALAPDAFIFHISRCGSTLLTQLLASLPHCIVMSEPPIIDSVLRLHHDLADAGMASPSTPALLRQVMLAMGQRRTGAERKFVIKFDCWHIHSIALLRQAFPDTPCLFLYREPLAVLASHQRQRGPQMVPGLIHPALLPLSASAAPPGDLDAYTAQVLQGLLAIASEQAQAASIRLVNYRQLPDLLFSELLAALSIDCSDEQRAAMQARSRFHSKYKDNSYDGDPQAARQDSLIPLAAQLDPAYQALENLRLA